MDISLRPNQKTVEINEAQHLEDKVKNLEAKVSVMSQMFYRLRNSESLIENKKQLNSDGIPLNSFFLGFVKGVDLPFVLKVDDEGKYFIDNVQYNSLSAAAEAVSNVRRSGWAFWQDFTGKSLGELYK